MELEETHPHEAVDPDEDILAPGFVVDGRYEIVRHIGQGGFANIYLATHTHLDRPAAIKVLDVPLSGSDAKQFFARFLREAKIAARVEHPNVVRIFDFGLMDDIKKPYLAMEHLRGLDLEQFTYENGPMEAIRWHGLFAGCLDALSEGHKLGVVHKDLKPSNLYIADPGTARERLVILDFGIARVYNQDSSKITQTGLFSGTPAYLAPEYITDQTVSPALDVYQMGLIMAETLTGIPAIEAESSMAYLMAHCQGDLVFHPKLASSSAGDMISQCVALDPKYRFQNASELATALFSIDPRTINPFDSDDTVESPPPTKETLAAPFAPTMPSLDDASEGQSLFLDESSEWTADPVRDTLRPSLIAGVVVALIVVAILAWTLWPQPEQEKEAEASPPTDTEKVREMPQTADDLPTETAQAKPVVAPPEMIELQIESVPTGATVLIGGIEVGQTPLTRVMQPDSTPTLPVVFKKEGYKRKKSTIPLADLLARGADPTFKVEMVPKTSLKQKRERPIARKPKKRTQPRVQPKKTKRWPKPTEEKKKTNSPIPMIAP